jgi:hypothetical protein
LQKEYQEPRGLAAGLIKNGEMGARLRGHDKGEVEMTRTPCYRMGLVGGVE